MFGCDFIPHKSHMKHKQPNQQALSIHFSYEQSQSKALDITIFFYL